MGCCDGCSRVCKQFLLLLWKNFILQIRRPIGTAFEVILPILAVVFILILRTALFPPEDRCFVTFESDPLSIPSQVPNVPPIPSGGGAGSGGGGPPGFPNAIPSSLPPIPPADYFYNIFYSPLTTETMEVADILERRLPNNTFNFTGFEDEATMVDSLQAADAKLFGCFRNGAGIVFENLTGTELRYKIRLRHEVGNQESWRTDMTAPVFELPGPRIQNPYLSEGFLHIQQLVSEAIIEWRAGVEGRVLEPVDVSVRQFPYPPYRVDFFLDQVSSFLPILLVMAFLYSAGIVVKELVLEKESRIRESMLMMGLKQWVLWSTWYLKQFLFLLISVIIISILLKAVVFPNSNFILILAFFTFFILSMISFCFFVSVWFNSSRVGLIVGFVAWFVNYFPFLFIAGRYDELSLGAKVGSCLLSNTCLGLGVEVLSRLEQRQEGLTFNNAASPVSADDDFHIGWVYLMLLIDSVLYMAVAWYVNGVKPGQYGVPKPFYFPFLPSYWCEGLRYSKVRAGDDNGLIQQEPSAHEQEPKDLTVGIRIRNLTKVYSQSIFRRFVNLISTKESVNKKAVDNLNLNMYKGQITALLGHNGAGKTTTMSILTGLYTPTAGSAEISGYSILRDMDLIRRSLGICPQHNILFDRLTVSEHLSFFLRLKGIYDRQRVKTEVANMIADLQLVEKSKIQSSRLSGGMKRKLSVGIALIGGSEVVILDEPTSGMDPYARRATWDLLIKHKQDRTVLLTTHFMDEADLLGDRIAIMAEGKLCCSGSSLFLKGRYGVGYHMTVVKEPNCVSSKVEDLVRSYVPTAEQVTDVGAELSFILPSSATAKFPELFDSLDEHKADLGVSSFGVSVTTMEEVFMKVREGTDETLESRLRRRNTASPLTSSSLPAIGQTRSPPPQSPSMRSPAPQSPPRLQSPGATSADEKSSVVIANLTEGDDIPLPGEVVPESDPVAPEKISHPSILEVAETTYRDSYITTEDDLAALKERDEPLSYNFTPNTGLVLWLQQFWAMFLKRFYNSLRFYSALVSQLILPLLFVLFALIVIVTAPARQDDDQPRAMLIRNSAQTPDNRTTFFAQFGGSLDLSAVSAADILATEYFDLTDEAQAIWQSVVSNPPATTEQCCGYEYQLLDKNCALKTAGELAQTCDGNFGYARCSDCLACCNATNASTSALPSCSHPSTFISPPNSNGDFCPSPPSLSLSSGSSGALDSNNTYVAEHLLREADRVGLAVFFRRYQAGFTYTARDPIYSVCDCQFHIPNVNDSGACESLETLKACEQVSEDCTEYSFNSTTMCADDEVFTRNGSLCDRTQNSCYSVDQTSADLVRFGACTTLTCGGASLADRLVSTIHPEQPSTPAITVWYNNAPYHMPAAALNAFHNIYLRNATGLPNIDLTVINHPLPRNATSRINDAASDPTGFGLSILVVFGYSFLLASFVLFLVNEKESKAKHLQFVSGVSPTSYWLAAYVWDMINSMIPIVLSIILFAAFQVDAYSGVGLGAVFLVLVLTCWASIPFTYIFSFLFSNSLAAFGILMLIFFFFSLFGLTIVFVVQFTVDNTTIADVLHYLFLISPTYGLSSALNDIFLNQNLRDVCDQIGRAVCEAQGVRVVDNPLDIQRPGVGVICLYLFFEGIIFFILTLFIQRKFFVPEMKRLIGTGANNDIDFATSTAEPLLRGEDSDVHAERKKVLGGGTTAGDVVVIKNLKKVYAAHLSGCSIRSSKLAVAGINLAIPNGECFGLLGVNGAGKTTTFSILTGDIPMSSGTAVIAGHDVRTNIKDVQQRIGYCPQFDALIERLTGRELLTMYARLRGIPEKQIKHVVDTEIRRLDLQKHASKHCGSYSGGNKRKLSTAIALVGNPPIVMLDEPTTGMDPTTRRYLWDVLTNITREGRSIILTSHSMEECEALCTRLAVMVNGSFKCLGSIQHLKNKYGAGFTLQAKVQLSSPPVETSPIRRTFSLRSRSGSLRRSVSREGRPSQQPNDTVEIALTTEGDDTSTPVAETPSINVHNPFDTTDLHTFIRGAFAGAILLEEHQGAVTYQLPSSGVTWSSVFRQLEQNRQRLHIVDYSVSQTTLDQVFINFAKEQHEEEF